MQSINLSKLVLSPYFFELLQTSGLSFDHYFTDNPILAQRSPITLIEPPVSNISFQKYQGSALFLLDQLGIQAILPFLKNQNFDYCKILDAQSGLGSLGKKLKPEIDYLNEEICQDYSPRFPFDLEGLLKGLQDEKNTLFLLTNQEVPINKYESSNDELQIIDKTIIEEPELLSLLSPTHADLLLIGTGNHFEELVKLSSYLEPNPEKIALLSIEKRELLSSGSVQQLIKSSKKIGIILDHLPTNELKQLLETTLGKPIHLLYPNYKNLTSFFPEYQFEQTHFDAQNLYTQSLQLLKQS